MSWLLKWWRSVTALSWQSVTFVILGLLHYMFTGGAGIRNAAAQPERFIKPERAVYSDVVGSDEGECIVQGQSPAQHGCVGHLGSSGNFTSAYMEGHAAQAVREAFQHAWRCYERDAFGMDELHPITQKGTDWFSLGLTIVDSLDTMQLMGLKEEYALGRSWVGQHLPAKLAVAGDVNFFEASIRVLGGLLSAFALGGDGFYRDMAQDIGDRLLPAFSSPSHIPYSDVNLATGNTSSPKWTKFSSTAEVTTVQMEFRYLAEITGDDAKYRVPADQAEAAVIEAARAQGRSGLVPIFVDPGSGKFQDSKLTLGARGDSYYEYLLKLWLQAGGSGSGAAESNRSDGVLEDDYTKQAYLEAVEGIIANMLKLTPDGSRLLDCAASASDPEDQCGATSPDGPAHRLLYIAELDKSLAPIHKMDHLACFFPGLLALGWVHGLGRHPEEPLRDHLQLARRLAYTCAVMYRDTATGLAPEIVTFHTEGTSGAAADSTAAARNPYGERKFESMYVKPADAFSLLRPETVESLFVLFRITGDERYRRWGWDIFQAIERHAKLQPLGFASVANVNSVPTSLSDKMESFFLAETLKYLFLLFSDEEVLDLGRFVLNTEAHPLPIRSVGHGDPGWVKPGAL
mmetsp:Transcript_115093/g.245908  ORF Transcript_115093/g.245908 Transcript_115093/m.245908 type:complete len:629 (-) Transcript_115093:16-1902(-)